jgi:N-acetyl-anhydromuramyl-L-alanine amidase AmpD
MLLEFVREKQAYHFVIDRFGRVHRIVAESDSANHAGRSVWADARWVYINLNSSFLGISFEGETQDLKENLTPAQIHAGRVLTDMLRSRYRIAKENCVTHAQVSVNPDNMKIGYHTDWAGNFPFHEMGLEDNYAQPIAALFLFGYGYDPTFVESTGARLWKGLLLAEERLLEEATVEGHTVAEHKKILQKRYREKLAGIEFKGDKS